VIKRNFSQQIYHNSAEFGFYYIRDAGSFLGVIAMEREVGFRSGFFSLLFSIGSKDSMTISGDSITAHWLY
jgi:hypothetical protein